ncbi:LAFE_0F08944g1_1 [Lachancea fermentati]|uniref:LAFE_0F08944g1_1 n=1 Tax=Lachancea fermentati TaxID=4955 RepID=A0A1G4MF69_LACFM|nr:LAFE_0F08944g1_1 [Lachancea fermentati]
MVEYYKWLSQLDDQTEVARLSLPGTHNSAACHTSLPSVRCQDCSVTEQLKNGVRFFDIRLGKLFFKQDKDEGYSADELQVIHGKFPVRVPLPLKFSSVLEEFYRFLDDNPNECCVVSLKQEGEDSWDNENEEFPNFLWDHYLGKNEGRWYLQDTLPRLQDVRGKVILFRRFGWNQDKHGRPLGINAAWWSYNTTNEDRGLFQVQDYCELASSEDIEKKATYVKDLIRTASQYNSTAENSPKLFVNYCSGSNFFNRSCWPEMIATKMKDCGIDSEIRKACGVVILDFAGKDDWSMVRRVVDSNF